MRITKIINIKFARKEFRQVFENSILLISSDNVFLKYRVDTSIQDRQTYEVRSVTKETPYPHTTCRQKDLRIMFDSP